MARAGGGVSLQRVRAGLVVLALLLVLAVGGFLGYARYRLNHLDLGFAGLSRRLGASITQESDNFTYSQSVGGRKVFTIHAAKQIDHGGGMFTLHDVTIVLYGQDAEHADRIHGSQFEYDQKKSVLRAVGEVYIDLTAPAREQPATMGTEAAREIHIKTSGLVFRQKERTATTDEQVDFQVGGSTGRALGASYDSGSGVVVLRSAVRVSGLREQAAGGRSAARPMVLTAANAEMDRLGNVVKLEGAKLVTETDTGTDTASAAHAVVHVAGDGTPRQVDAEGHVVLTAATLGGGQGSTTADRMRLDLNEAGEPRLEHLLGDVRLAVNDPRRQQQGHAAEALVTFDAVGRPVHALLTGGVELAERETGSERQLHAARLDLALAGGGKQPVLLMGAVASGPGGASLRTVDRRPDQSSMVSALRGEVLTASFAEDALFAKKPGTHLTAVEGRGGTYLEQVSMDRKGKQTSRQTSTGDTLDAEFRPDATGRATLTTAVQRGAVRVVREMPGKPALGGAGAKPVAAQVQHASSEVATYDADADRLVLTGGVQVQDAESALFADRVQMDHATGDSFADGSVRVSYLQTGSSAEPMHVLAAHAVSHQATGVSEFLGGPAAGGRAKMWQGGSQVEAPLLVFHRTERRVEARDEHGAEGAVHTVLVGAGGSDPKQPGKAPNPPLRVVSREANYDDAKRQVHFAGDVRVVDKDGTMRAQEATVYLLPATHAEPSNQGGAPMSLGGRVDRIVGTGTVVLEQPGRTASGERLVYTAADRTFVLTGTASDPPKMVDALQGSVTGASLRFKSGEDRVVISGQADGTETRRVHSEAKVKGKESR